MGKLLETKYLSQQIEISRKELKNLRQDLLKIKKINEKQVKYITNLLTLKLSGDGIPTLGAEANGKSVIAENIQPLGISPVAYVRSCFKNKNGTPHQPTVCPVSKATIHIEKSAFTNPEHSVSGLSEFSHIWLIFAFHQSGQSKEGRNFTKSKVHPPRLNGNSVGVFATRSPHRPNPIGLTLTHLEKIEGSVLHVTGVDLIDGTPILDIKPYIPMYDYPNEKNWHFQEACGSSTTMDSENNYPFEGNCHFQDIMNSLSKTPENISPDDRKYSISDKNIHLEYSSLSENLDSEHKLIVPIADVHTSKNNHLLQESDKAIHSSTYDYIKADSKLQDKSAEWNNCESIDHVPLDGTCINIPKLEETFQNVTNIKSSKYYCRKVMPSLPSLEVQNSDGANQSVSNDASDDALSLSGTNDVIRNTSFVTCSENCNYTAKSKTFQKHDFPINLHKCISVASWVTSPPLFFLSVVFSKRAEKEIRAFHNINSHNAFCKFCLKYLNGFDEAKQAIINVLQADPRSSYRRKKCNDRLYFFVVDNMHITSWFDNCYSIVEVLRILPVTSHLI